MFDLRGLDWEAKAVMLILGGHEPCWICKSKQRTTSSWLCSGCRWRYLRRSHHAVIHYILRAEHKENDKRLNRLPRNYESSCWRCKRFYGASNPQQFASEEGMQYTPTKRKRGEHESEGA